MRDHQVIVRAYEDRWEARHINAPHFQIDSWHLRKSLDEAIDAALSSPPSSSQRKE